MSHTTRRIRIICLTVLALAVILPVLFCFRHPIGVWLADYGHGLPLILLCSITGGPLLFLVMFAFLWLINIVEDDTTGVELVLHTLGILMAGGLVFGWWLLARLADWAGTPWSWAFLIGIPLLECRLMIRLMENAPGVRHEPEDDLLSWRDRLANQIIRFAKDHIAIDRDESKETDDGC
ncbi:hypothetical protein [Bifidobacterium sp. SO1]|uniref:hypothetical protein n=1 Tax=Bifidobacterium sp. SO1 TaxID=2809029 RepID=UPI001BDC7503|nr:hypothetical protein [Bifidobacterium sp. SO1]MBT1162111.1 hypothetical protein [Bifidobacterium sp. SO1]